jgi:hypothetical protein
MPLFYFVLKAGRENVPDREGLEFPDQETAHAHALIVARELMRNREPKTRTWRIAVRDHDLQPCSEVLFATIDETIAHLRPSHRQSVEALSNSTATLFDAVDQVQNTLFNVRDTLARADEMMAHLRRQISSRKENGP